MPRTKQFDETAVLDKAVEVFWKKGYHGTSMQDLVDALGINRGSMYSVFKGKHELFQAALQRYRQTNNVQTQELFKSPGTFKDKVVLMFDAAIKESIDDLDRKGCFMVNTTTELVPHDSVIKEIIKINQETIEQVFEEAIQKDQEAGVLRQDLKATEVAQFIYTVYAGFRVVAKKTPTPERLQAIKRMVLEILV